jgi:RNA polymerase sigma-70 factor (ECF subfamily)
MDAPRLQINTSLKSYLFAGIKNKFLDYQKHLKVTEKYKSYSLFKSDNADQSSDYYFAESELRQALEKSLSKLAPRCREIFELSRFSGLSNMEISTKLGISKRTVELQISNSLRILRTELVEYLTILVFICLF